jgi:methyl-accepting chemotaxis protein
MLDEIALAAHGIQQSCGTLNTAVYEVAEHSEEQHDRVYNAVDMLDGVAKESGELSQRAEALLDQAALCAGATAETLPETLAALEYAVRELVTTVRLTSFGTEEAAGTMRQVAALVVDNRGEAQLAWQASQALGKTASELNQLVDFFSTTSKED